MAEHITFTAAELAALSFAVIALPDDRDWPVATRTMLASARGKIERAADEARVRIEAPRHRTVETPAAKQGLRWDVT